MAALKAKVEGVEQVNHALKKVPKDLIKKVAQIISLNARAMQRYIRQEHLTGGTTDTKLRVRSGKLRGSVLPLKTETNEERVEGGVSIGTIYGRTHFGPEGQETTITPKKGKYLTIPLPAAMTKAGVLRGAARSGPWGETFLAKTKAGNLVIFGKLKVMKGKSAGKLRKRIVPLFVLKKSVTIPARVHPDEILDWVAPKITRDLETEGIKT